jgi:hypothetical protein
MNTILNIVSTGMGLGRYSLEVDNWTRLDVNDF